jgi:hypothetical protein
MPALALRLDGAALREAEDALAGIGWSDLQAWRWRDLPLGELVLPTVRWSLRRHHLDDDEPTRRRFREFLVSAASLAIQLDAALERLRPRALVVFNGLTFPEAVARSIARRMEIPTITHEVGLRPYSAYFSHQEATFRSIELPVDYELSPEEERGLDAYLQARFRGRFSMAGVRFWPQMEPVSGELRRRMAEHRQTLAIFTNVIFDTSQVHANTLFEDMFDWLDDLAGVIAAHPETLFVFRAHPDEDRPGKASHETVAGWIERKGLAGRPNVAFFGPSEYISSYDLIQQAKATLVYNSSIGLEASILGRPVLCAGRSRYTQLATVLFPASRPEYHARLEKLLQADAVPVPVEHVRNARRFLHFELFRASLDLGRFLEPFPAFPGMVRLARFDPQELVGEGCRERAVLLRGILQGESFVYPAAG